MRRSCTTVLLLAAATLAFASGPTMPRYHFQNFTTADGLPNDHVYAVLVDGDRIWAGTDNGLGLYENGKWKTYTTSDGLAHRAVLSLALDKRTGDVWAGTMGGLSRVSGGRIDSFTQLNSGLSNDVVYGVSVEGENVWIATAAGACRLNLHTNEWSLYNERNTPMVEIWSYSVSATPSMVYYGIWGSGVGELNQKSGVWDKYDDPDGENELVLFKDSGTDPRGLSLRSATLSKTKCCGRQPILATATTMAATGTTSSSKTAGSPRTLPITSREWTASAPGSAPTRGWPTTTASIGPSIAPPSKSSARKAAEMTVRDAQGNVTSVPVTTAPAHNYILGIDFQRQDIWVATAKGLSHGILERPEQAAIHTETKQ